MIDLLFTDCDCIKEAGVKDLNISDHSLIFMTRKKVPPPSPSLKHPLLEGYRSYDKTRFQNQIANSDGGKFVNTPSPDDAWEILINIISKTIEKMCPLKVIKINKLKEEWISQELLEQIKLKDELLTIAKRTENIFRLE